MRKIEHRRHHTIRYKMKLFNNKQENGANNFDNFPAIGGLMVSKMVVDQNIKPRFMYREKRTRPEDSGWRIFTGFETDDYTNNPDSIGIYNPSTILKIDPSIQDILLKGIGSVYEKAEDNTEWYKVTDFELEDDYLINHRLTEEWMIEINNMFERKVEESSDLLYTTGDKSVRITIRNEAGKNRNEISAEYLKIIKNRDQTSAKTLKTFDFSDEEIRRLGYLIQEDNTGKHYGVVYAFSIADNQAVQAAFYFDEEEDLNWAIETWKKIKLKK